MEAAVSGDDRPEPMSPSPSTHIRPACDNCRVRKIRCDRQDPCSHCVNAKINCTVVDRKPREKRTRILVTPQYEKKIDQLDRRLGEVLELLRNHSNGRQFTPNTISRTLAEDEIPTASPSISTQSSHAVQPATSAVLGVGGESSLAAHSAFACDFMHQVAGSTALQTPGSEMRGNLDALSHIVSSMREQTVASEMAYPHARPNQRPGPTGRELPPIKKTVELIRLATNQRLAGTGLIYEFISMRNFSDICLQVYFSDSFSETDFIIVNAGLCSLFGDYSNHVPVKEKDAYLGHADACRANLETALSDLPLHLPTTPNAASALLFGAWHAIELSKPYLSWALSNKASELCQTLGYHRIPEIDTSDDAKFKKFLFWTNYFLDKSLSLRLGRSSSIADWDITTRRPSTSDPHKEPAMAYFVLWVEAARCQGNIYQMLYSPEAVTQPDHIRQSRAQLLVDNLRTLEQATQETHNKWIQIAKHNAGKDLMDFFATSDDILRLSLLTLVLRAAPQAAGAPTTFIPSCTEAARATLHRHQDCLAIIERSNEDLLSTYVHWTLLFAPFIPFIVVFCQVIETQDTADLDCLGSFVTSIQPAAAASEAAAKLHRLFQVLHGVAARYVEISARQDDGQPQAAEERDAYLNLLCIPSMAEGSGGEQDGHGIGHDPEGILGEAAAGRSAGVHSGSVVMNPMVRMGHESHLEEWFYSNQALMESFQTLSHEFAAEKD